MSLDRVATDEEELVTAAPGATVGELARLMARKGVGSVVIESAQSPPSGAIRRGPLAERDDGDPAPVGIVTERDIVLGVLADEVDPASRNAADVMTADPVTVRSEDDLLTCCRLLGQHQVRRAPVVDETGAMAGIVTLDDVLRRLGEQIDALRRVVDDVAAVTRSTDRPERS